MIEDLRAGKPFVGTEWETSSSFLDPLIAAASGAAVPWPVLLAMARRESYPWWGGEIPERFEAHLDDYSIGLLQVLRETAAGVLGLPGMEAFAREVDLADLDSIAELLRKDAANLAIGARYLRDQFDHLREIPNLYERTLASVASYNAGRGNVNRCLARARDADGLPRSFRAWKADGRPPGRWQTYEAWSVHLPTVTGAAAATTLGYVSEVRRWAGEVALLADLYSLG